MERQREVCGTCVVEPHVQQLDVFDDNVFGRNPDMVVHEHVRRNFSASRPKHNPPCVVAGDGLTDGYNSKGEVDEPGANVGKDVEKCEDNCGSSMVPRNMDGMEWLF